MFCRTLRKSGTLVFNFIINVLPWVMRHIAYPVCHISDGISQTRPVSQILLFKFRALAQLNTLRLGDIRVCLNFLFYGADTRCRVDNFIRFFFAATRQDDESN